MGRRGRRGYAVLIPLLLLVLAGTVLLRYAAPGTKAQEGAVAAIAGEMPAEISAPASHAPAQISESTEEAPAVPEAAPEPETAAEQETAAEPGTVRKPEPFPEQEPLPWNLVLVNRTHPVPEDWEVTTVQLPNGTAVDERIYVPLMEMFEAARGVNAGMLPNVESGYRSAKRQQEIFDSYMANYLAQGWSEAGARAETEKWVAVPGTSEHQLGIAVDVSGAVYAIYGWLQQHCWEYGFIHRYPPDKTDITGYSGEEWHYRYVGKEAAREIHELGLTLEEYLEKIEAGKASVRPAEDLAR